MPVYHPGRRAQDVPLYLPFKLEVFVKRIALWFVAGCIFCLVQDSGALIHAQGLQGGGIGVPMVRSPSGRPVRQITGLEQISDYDFVVNAPTPMARVIEFLQRRLHISISYESPMWILESADVTYAGELAGNRDIRFADGRGPVVPREAIIRVSLPLLNPNPDYMNIIQSVVDDHMARRNPGEFKVLDLGLNEYSVVGVGSLDATGRRVDHFSPLDMRISFESQERTIAETLDVIIDAINLEFGMTKVVRAPAFGGIGYFDVERRHLGADNETARSVLLKLFRVPGQAKFSWRLGYTPHAGTYVLGVSRVEGEIELPGGERRLVDVKWPRE